MIEISLGISRLINGKDPFIPGIRYIEKNKYPPSHPCIEMRTDVLLNHVHNGGNECNILGGKVVNNEYVEYDVSNNKDPVLLTLGGSTTDGFYQQISSGETYPKKLAELMKNDFNILNGGTGAYGSLQELYKFMRDGPRIKNLKLVISLNGSNELPNYHGNNEDRKYNYPFLTEIQKDMNNKQIWIDQRIKPNYWLPKIQVFLPNTFWFYRYVSKKFKNLNKKTYTDLEFNEGENFIIERTDSYFNPIDAADRWEINVKRLNSLVNLQGARYFVFLQPTLGIEGVQSQPKKGTYDEHLYKATEKRGLRKKIRPMFRELKKRCAKLYFCHDITDVAPPTGSVYYDPRHHNAAGNKILASEIWKIIQANN